MSEAALEVRNLEKRFPADSGLGIVGRRSYVHAVDDVSFTLRPGTITALVGRERQRQEHGCPAARAAVYAFGRERRLSAASTSRATRASARSGATGRRCR